MSTLFVSDLHLDDTRPQATRAFLDFLGGAEVAGAQALFILGDLFEAWVGDDDPSDCGAAVASALAGVSGTGLPVYFMRGNRDFLLGCDYARRCGMRLLPDPCVMPLAGRPVLLMHGDLLCTRDTGYQAVRRQVRDPNWQTAFLAQPLQARIDFARQARDASRSHHDGLAASGQAETITDVDPATVADHLRLFDVDLLVHGHTHRPALHESTVEGRRRQRVVLGDWYEQGSVLRLDGDGPRLGTLSIT
ncbi:MAG: UDP-2,3-diacylglucosamine diphosphatase [Lysobacteraceae bacterium]